ncbi:MAG TPA: hypothetical protein VNS11_03570 [Sphingomicrobium sp.]|nr:hypothetical protein [Sphingomicrobium sp.]
MKLLRLFRSRRPKRTVAYHVNGRIVIATIQKTTAGLGLENDPQIVIAPFEAVEVARTLRRALEASTRVIEHPAQNEWKGTFQPMAKAAGVRSWKAFVEKAKGVAIDEIDGSVRITPYLSLGSKEGFKEALDERVTTPDLKAATNRLLQHFRV